MSHTESILIGGVVVTVIVIVNLLLVIAGIALIEAAETWARYARRRVRDFLAVVRESRVATEGSTR